MTTHALRYYQRDLVDATDRSWSRVSNVLGVCATGSGKTVIAAHILAAETGGSCFIAHRTELVSQASLALAREGVRHRVIGPKALQSNCVRVHMANLGANYVDPGARCAVAGVNTLLRVSPSDPWASQVRLWIVDEAHHLLAENSWGKAVSLFPRARGLGLTATPMRADGKGLGRHADGLIDEMVQGPEMSTLIREGWLTPYRVFCPPSDLDLSGVGVSASGDYSPEPLRAAVKKSHITGDVVAHYLKVAPGKLGMTFCASIESALEVAQEFNAAGVPAQVITGDTDPLARNHIMRKFRAAEVKQLVSVDILGEGTDVPAVEVVSFARPTQSFGLYSQQFGRALRILPGKTHAMIIDHVGNVLRHRLPDAKRVWTLDRREKRSSTGPSDAIPIRVCANPECNAPYERVLPACPYCGTAPEPTQRGAPEFVDGDLRELDPSALAALRGEIERIDGPVKIPYGLGGMAARGAVNQWRARQDAQKMLREKMALWGGWQAAQERPTPEAQKRFYFRFGHDVATAMTLGAREAEELRVLICDDLDENGVTEK